MRLTSSQMPNVNVLVKIQDNDCVRHVIVGGQPGSRPPDWFKYADAPCFRNVEGNAITAIFRH